MLTILLYILPPRLVLHFNYVIEVDVYMLRGGEVDFRAPGFLDLHEIANIQETEASRLTPLHKPDKYMQMLPNSFPSHAYYLRFND